MPNKFVDFIGDLGQFFGQGLSPQQIRLQHLQEALNTQKIGEESAQLTDQARNRLALNRAIELHDAQNPDQPFASFPLHEGIARLQDAVAKAGLAREQEKQAAGTTRAFGMTPEAANVRNQNTIEQQKLALERKGLGIQEQHGTRALDLEKAKMEQGGYEELLKQMPFLPQALQSPVTGAVLAKLAPGFTVPEDPQKAKLKAWLTEQNAKKASVDPEAQLLQNLASHAANPRVRAFAEQKLKEKLAPKSAVSESILRQPAIYGGGTSGIPPFANPSQSLAFAQAAKDINDPNNPLNLLFGDPTQQPASTAPPRIDPIEILKYYQQFGIGQ